MYKIIFRLHRPTARRINTMASKRKNEHTVGVYHNKKLYFSSVGILQEENSNAIPTESVEMENYTKAIYTLNGLQSNASSLQDSVIKKHQFTSPTLIQMQKYLVRSGLSLNELDKLPVIHVSGTKGKGSTCAFIEAILRSFNVKTGFFSSPHLVSVTERIRLNGIPLSKCEFAEYFWRIHNALESQKENEKDMPGYMTFLTILCFHIFLDKDVKAAIIEVGIGGEFDCTNIIRTTKSVGITSLGLEHTKLLGNSLSEIAWQKAGIIKEKSSVFTVTQPLECIKIIEDRTLEKKARLCIVPDWSEYKFWKPVMLSIDHPVQKLNASLALQISYDWLRRNSHLPLKNVEFISRLKKSKKLINLEVPEEACNGLQNWFWPGRCQQLKLFNSRIFLDGAHTHESIQVCIEWFQQYIKRKNGPKYLIFNMTGDRDVKQIMKQIYDEIQFDKAFFTPNIPTIKSNTRDNVNLTVTDDEQMLRCIENANFWESLHSNKQLNIVTKRELNMFQEQYANSVVFSSVENVINFLRKDIHDMKNVDILVTGSLHLVGATLIALDEFKKRA